MKKKILFSDNIIKFQPEDEHVSYRPLAFGHSMFMEVVVGDPEKEHYVGTSAHSIGSTIMIVPILWAEGTLREALNQAYSPLAYELVKYEP